MKETLDRFKQTMEAALPKLLQIGEERAAERPGPRKWSRKEVLGHLIDSASNNHQRFVRAQLVQALSFPPYEQEGFVLVQAYQEARWAELVELPVGFTPAERAYDATRQRRSTRDRGARRSAPLLSY